MLDAIDRLGWLGRQMDEFWNGSAQRGVSAYPSLNLWDDGEAFHAEAELAGLRIPDLELAVAGAELRIHGKRSLDKEGWAVLRRECRDGEFSRTVTFPAEIQADKVRAELRDGVLRITLPKAPSAKPRRIDVKVLGQKK